MNISIKRVWDPRESTDGSRWLVTSRWPPGVASDSLAMIGWIRELGPDRKMEKLMRRSWAQFETEYRDTLPSLERYWEPIVRQARLGAVTLLYTAKDRQNNHARVLASFLNDQLTTDRPRKGAQ